jgi:hypothetical protein
MDCESMVHKCRPEYCSSNKNGASKSWGYCNMLRWKHIKESPNYKLFKTRCMNTPQTQHKKTKKTISVNAELLHQKMPYIWRFLKPKTRRKMIELAKQPVDKINVPFMVFTKDKHPTKKIKQLRKKYKHI